MTIHTIAARPVTHPDYPIFWRAEVHVDGLFIAVAGNYDSELEALRAANRARDGIVAGLTPEVRADMDRRANAILPASNIAHTQPGGGWL